jgi:hypothetical protein
VKHFPEKKIDVYVSPVTIKEVLKNYSQKSLETFNSYNKSVKELNKVVMEKTALLPKDFHQTQMEQYEQFFRETLRKNKIRVFPYPNISHEEVIAHYYAGKKPFDHTDNGYKDFLIWRSIIELLKTSSRELVFITQDTDFQSEGILHQDLQDNLTENGIDPGRVKIVHSFNDYNKKYLEDIYQTVKIKEILKNKHEEQQLKTLIIEELRNELSGLSLKNYRVQIRSEYIGPEISYIYNIEALQIIDIDMLNQRNVIIHFECTSHCKIDFQIDKNALAKLDDAKMPEITDHDWDFWTVRGEDNIDLHVEGRVICDTSLQLIHSIEISSVIGE